MSYCSSLTNNQVQNVLCAEAQRINRLNDSEVLEDVFSSLFAAKQLYQEALIELLRRGIDPNEVLMDHQTQVPE